MRLAWRVALAGALALSAHDAGAAALHRSDAGLSPDERRAADAVIEDALARLPDAWSRALPPLTLIWRDGLPPRVAGHYARGTVQLRRGLLAAGAAAEPAHPARRAAVAALLHELAHAWDRSPAGGLSREPRLLDLAGWPASPLGPGRGRRNAFRDRTPDAYELDSPGEFVAVNLEHVLLDPDYACRRPALYRHFAARLGLPAAPACAPPAFVQADADAASPVLTLDPARVYAVDYLLAEPDAQPMSRWGHAMLRLVVCAPGRAPGPDCRLDLDSHVVLSFRAFVDDVQVSSWRGLTGRYPSRLFVLPLARVVDDYTAVELRGLRSVPLRLSSAEIADVVERAAQLHWSYDGRYRFVDNNCAVETWRLLHDAVPRLAQLRLRSLTPTGLLARLEREGVADASVLADADAARRSGHRFDAASAYYAQLFDVVRAQLPLPARDVRAWLELAPAARAPWLDRGDVRATAALLVLEAAALRRQELRAGDALKRRLRAGERHVEVDDGLALAARMARPAALLPGGYGRPTGDELAALAGRTASDAADWRRLRERLREAAMHALPPERRLALEATRANVDALSRRLRGAAASATATR